MDKAERIKINGGELLVSESGNGFPLIFVHAGIGNSRMWDDQVASLETNHRVITYDMRGFGLSEKAAGEYSHYKDLIAILDHLNVEKCILIGCSKGGGVVIDTALAAPQRVAGLVVVSGIAHGFELQNEPLPPALWDEAVKAFKAGDLEKVNELEVQMWVDGYNQAAGRADPPIREKVHQMNAIVLQNEVNSPEAAEQVLEPKAGMRLEEIVMPTLFISGDLDDPYILQAIQEMVEIIPEASHEVIPNAAHLPNMEAPEVFNKILSKFVNEVRCT